MDNQHQERVNRLRNVLRKMEKSIEDARTRRESSTNTGQVPGYNQNRIHTSPDLDTPIIGSNQQSHSNSTPLPPRNEANMFNFDEPRLKARPKRRPAI